MHWQIWIFVKLIFFLVSYYCKIYSLIYIYLNLCFCLCFYSRFLYKQVTISSSNLHDKYTIILRQMWITFVTINCKTRRVSYNLKFDMINKLSFVRQRHALTNCVKYFWIITKHISRLSPRKYCLSCVE